MRHLHHVRRSSLMAWALAVTFTGSIEHASAHAARVPAFTSILVAPNDPDRLWATHTQGLLTSPDRGCTWYWNCEEGVGIFGWEDPLLSMANGSFCPGRSLACTLLPMDALGVVRSITASRASRSIRGTTRTSRW
ncbi:MAG TPA: hypothetical protein VK524_02015 [Polyangiaceae bacterium]|nr:hypothetical protein [Polyangiaceae bacterium]